MAEKEESKNREELRVQALETAEERVGMRKTRRVSLKRT